MTLQTGFSELTASLGISDRGDPVAAVHSALAGRSGGWLLIFDNVTDPESVNGLLPPAGAGQVMITTQNQRWPADQLIDIPVLDDGTSADFLITRMSGPTERKSAEALAAELGGLGGLPPAAGRSRGVARRRRGAHSGSPSS